MASNGLLAEACELGTIGMSIGHFTASLRRIAPSAFTHFSPSWRKTEMRTWVMPSNSGAACNDHSDQRPHPPLLVGWLDLGGRTAVRAWVVEGSCRRRYRRPVERAQRKPDLDLRTAGDLDNPALGRASSSLRLQRVLAD